MAQLVQSQRRATGVPSIQDTTATSAGHQPSTMLEEDHDHYTLESEAISVDAVSKMSSANADANVMTTEDLRNSLVEFMKNKGLLGKLQSQLRNQLVVGLKGFGLNQMVGHGGHDLDGGESLPLRAVNSLVADHLKQIGYDYSLSIFLPESGMAQDKLLTTKDLLQLLRVSSQSKLYKRLTDLSVGQTDVGFLWKFVREMASVNSRPTLDNGTQTEYSRLPVTSIEEEFRKVDAYYSSLDEGGSSRVAAVEERILAYQRHVEERGRSELQMAIARFKDNELARLRIEERENTRKEIEKSRREMESTYRAKHDTLIERERNFTERMQKHNEMIEKENFAQRQTILEEMESVKQREAQLRRQNEINNRERQLAEEKLKSLEEMARRREESARRMELELDQRIRTEVEKFKVEEQSRFLERLRNLEFREEKVKDNERRLGDELQEVTHLKVEVREKRSTVGELEAELIRVKHELIGARKQNELFSERSREMADYQMLKEDNAVLRRELDNAKTQILELKRDIMVERQKHEDLLREMGHVASKPTPEVGLLRKQIDQLQLSLRTERSLGDHTKLQLEQRLETEMDRSKQLLTKFQEQSWRQKEINWQTQDLRQQLIDREQAFGMKPSDMISRTDSPCDLIDGGSRPHLPILGDPTLYQDVVDPHLLFDSPSRTLHTSVDLGNSIQSDDCSYSSDLVRDTKKRLRRIDSETEKLDKWYQDCQLRAVSLAPVLGPERPVSVPSNRNESNEKTRTESHFVTGAGQTSDALSPPGPSLDVIRRSDFDKVDNSDGRSLRWESGRDNTATVERDTLTSNRRASESKTKTDSVKQTKFVLQNEDPTQRKVELRESGNIEAIHSSSSREPARSSDVREPARRFDVREPIRSSDVTERFQSSDISSSATIERVDEKEKTRVSDDYSELLKISLDDAWKPAQNADKLQKEAEEERRRRESEEEKFEEERKRRIEERRREEEEAWTREQEALDQLRSKDRRPDHPVKDDKEDQREAEASDVSESSKESAIDPELRKYMAIVQKKRDEEKQQLSKQPTETNEAKVIEEESVVTTDEVVSAPEDRSDIEASGDDAW